jgi:hypothetical protein
MAQVALISHSCPKTQRVKDRISKRISQHAVANTWWDPKSLPTWLTEECYVQRIQPLLTNKRVREIAEAMQVSQPYAAFVRSGRRRAHPRHWKILAELIGISRVRATDLIRTHEAHQAAARNTIHRISRLPAARERAESQNELTPKRANFQVATIHSEP